MKPSSLFVVSLALAAPALAQSAPPAAGGMTLDRFVARHTERIMAADTDGDGRVSKAEMQSLASRGGRDPARMFDRMDANHDGYLDRDEIRTALTARFHRMDRNGDGVLGPDERMAGRGAKAAGNPATPQP